MKSVQEIISQVMTDKGFRHKYEVAEYFGVTPQALSTWFTNGQIPSKHILKVQTEIQSLDLPPAIDPTMEDKKTVINYLINENIRLKNEIAQLKGTIQNIQSNKNKDDLIERINARSLFIAGRLSDGIITNVSGDWNRAMGYDEKNLVGHRYDEDFIHPDEFERTQRHREILQKSTGIKETRFSTIQRWKNGQTGEYIMLSMIWYVDVENDLVEIIAKPIDSDFGEIGVMN
ncbi:MAG: PAS domain S-box protein [Candidatus Marinimicrobia bacterium]|jgi:PAS domain S-box-containing protein|nr:PAS domain S-box protein [Candidatus Neomarinimicrobiota bacterium]MBT3675386.1 PAS domain S-box protein [Candidatus Neomarinimicrobiota bacterium]MBT3762701.1 PAS domain S-box protein [Candidatus Neomarinimicrobiota bacterium]MBT4068973.1 PAS domain S-box protein [Candidatus Neomarinimicrobiota bacterium]MBT4269905.1 PAS domain S-box protein [Candidatus Neomarinimicrobiota bacterium]